LGNVLFSVSSAQAFFQITKEKGVKNIYRQQRHEPEIQDSIRAVFVNMV